MNESSITDARRCIGDRSPTSPSAAASSSTLIICPSETGPNANGLIAFPSGSLRRNFTWTLLGNVVYAATQWGILLLIARLGDPEAVGRFSLGLAITAPIMLLSSLQLRFVQATDTRLEFQFCDYAGLRILMTTIGALMIFGISIGFYRGETAITIAMFGLSKSIEALSDVFYGLWQQSERMDLIAKSLMLRGVLALIAVLVCFMVFHSVWVAVGGMAAAWAVVLITFDFRNGLAIIRQKHQTASPRFAITQLKQLGLISLPLGLVTMLISLNGNIPRYMISHFRTVRDLGIFSALSYILVAGAMLVSALGQSAIPRLASYAAKGEMSKFNKLSYQLFVIGLTMGICGVLIAQTFGRQLITLVYGAEYAQSYRLFIWLMIAAGAGYMASFAGNCLTAARHFRVQLPLYSFLTILTLILCYAMAKVDGAVGVSKAMAVVGVLHMVAILLILRFAEMRRTAAIP